MSNVIEHAEETSQSVLHTTPSLWATGARYEAATGMITVDMNRGFSVSFHKSRSQALHKATDEQLSEVEVFNPGFSVFFPRLDDGFTVDGMLAGRFGNRHWERAWGEANGLFSPEKKFDSHSVAA